MSQHLNPAGPCPNLNRKQTRKAFLVGKREMMGNLPSSILRTNFLLPVKKLLVRICPQNPEIKMCFRSSSLQVWCQRSVLGRVTRCGKECLGNRPTAKKLSGLQESMM